MRKTLLTLTVAALTAAGAGTALAVTPPTSVVTPPTSVVTPPTSVVTPPTSAVVPPTTVVVPPTSAVTPPTSVVTPPTSVVTPPAIPDLDCGDFPNRDAAQAKLDETPDTDPHRLDADNDRLACEVDETENADDPAAPPASEDDDFTQVGNGDVPVGGVDTGA